ncbi:hypothetical protein ACFLU5_16965 [Bacteroidota bacterium]
MFKQFRKLNKGYQRIIWVATIVIGFLLPVYLKEVTQLEDFFKGDFFFAWFLWIIGFALCWVVILIMLWIIEGFSHNR